MNARALHLLAWLLALACAAQRLDRGRHGYDSRPDRPPEKHRADGNGGHAEIDFGGQWVMGRMVATGRGHDLYDRNRQWEVVRAAYPRADESDWVRRSAFPFPIGVARYAADAPHHDADWMMYWFMGTDSPRWADAGQAVALPIGATAPISAAVFVYIANTAFTPDLIAGVTRKAVGGPLYPPVHALLFTPLGATDRPQTAYRILQLILIGSAFVTGLGVARLSGGRIPWPVAAALVLAHPGFRAAMELGQNSPLTLTILVWGWALAARGWDGWGGVVWGLLAFKPVWAVAFFLVPLLMRRWRFCAAMLAAGAGLAALTLPVVGLQAWFDWLAVGREAAALYKVNRNWVFLSRDLFGLPRRALLDFSLPEADRDWWVAGLAGWGLWAAVLVGTAVVYLRRGDRARTTGPAAAFLFLGAYLCCYRFMYYDALVSAVAWAVLYAGTNRPRAWSVPTLVLAGLLVLENALVRQEYQLIGTPLNTGVRYPWDTVLLLVMWGWMGWRVSGDSNGVPARP